MPEFPDIRSGSQFGDTASRAWQNLMREVRAVAGMQVGDGLDFTKVGEVMQLALAPSILQRQPATRTVVLVEPVDPASMVLTVREVRYRETPPADPANITYTWHEDVFQAFPEIGAQPSDYEDFLWDTTIEIPVEEGEPLVVLDEPQVGLATFLTARYKLDAWVLELPGGESIRTDTVLVAVEAGLTDDHLVCRAVGSDPVAFVPILVAKPWLLRKTPWDGQTRGQVRYEYDLEDSTKRTAFDSTDATDQLKRDEQIHPRYLVDDQLTVSPATTGIGVDTGEVDDDGLPIFAPVVLLDLNVDSRGWKTYYEWL